MKPNKGWKIMKSESENYVFQHGVHASTFVDWKQSIRRDWNNPLYSLSLSLYSGFLFPEDD
jgi:hypothetical protein